MKPKANKTKKESSQKTHKKYRLKNPYRICLMAAAVLLAVSLVWAIAVDFNHASANIEICFDAVNSGENPDGSMFNIYEMKWDAVLQLACEKLDNEIQPEELKKHLYISSNTTKKDLEQVNQSILAGQTNFLHNAVLYTVSYDVVSDEVKAEGFAACADAVIRNFSYPSKTKILDAVVRSYKEYYRSTHIVSDDVLNTDWADIRQSDYYNQGMQIQYVLDRMSRYFKACYELDTEFVSEKAGLGFGDLQRQVTNLINLDWADYNSYVITNGVTSNKACLIRQFNYMKKNYMLMNQRDLSEYTAIQSGIAIYDPTVTRVVFIPALDGSDGFYMNRTKIGIDYMIENANAVKISADTNQYSAEYCDYLIENFSGSDPATDDEFAEAEKKRDSLLAKIDAIAETAREVNREYRLEEAYVEISSEAAVGFDGLGAFVMQLGSCFVSLSVIVLFAYYFIGYIKKSRLFESCIEEV